jgi:membrane protease YdiL (CAAX protease family)
VSGFFLGALLVFLTIQGLIFAGVDVMNAPAVQLVISTVMLQGVAFGLLALGYLKLSGLGFDFLALRRPTLRDGGWIVSGLTVFFVLYVLLLLVPFSLLLIGPGEEVLFRGLIQGTLRQTFRPWSAIVIASAIFAVSHASALTGDGQFTYMAVVFILALILGVTYEYAENLIIPTVIHGIYNAILFSFLYLQVT